MSEECLVFGVRQPQWSREICKATAVSLKAKEFLVHGMFLCSTTILLMVLWCENYYCAHDDYIIRPMVL